MRNVSKLLVPALFAGVLAAAMPAQAAQTHAHKPKTEKVKVTKVTKEEKKHASKPAKAD